MEISKQEDFTELMINAINRSNREIVRIHQSGDFYSQEYLDKWIKIANSLPMVKFYAFTKSFTLDFSDIPDNLVIYQSTGSCHDELIDWEKNTGRVIDNEGELKDNEYLCPYHKKDIFTKCGEYCNHCLKDNTTVKHVAFIKH